MTAQQMPTLESLHQSTGALLKLGHRLLTAIMVMGTLFCMFSFILSALLQQPEAFLHTQGFMLNYVESAQTEASPQTTTQSGQFTKPRPKDPNWDGAMAGASLGFTLGQNIPFIGMVGGPALGAILGYQLDSRV